MSLACFFFLSETTSCVYVFVLEKTSCVCEFFGQKRHFGLTWTIEHEVHGDTTLADLPSFARIQIMRYVGCCDDLCI